MEETNFLVTPLQIKTVWGYNY